MVTNRKVTGTAMSMPAGLALGGLASLAVTVAGSVLAAHLILKERIPESGVGYCSLFILLLSSVLGAAISVNRIKRRRLYVCALSAAVYYGILLSITALFFGGQYQGMGVTALVVTAGSGVVALLGAKGEKTRGKRHSKFKHR